MVALKEKGYKYGYICMKSVYKALGYGEKSCSVIAIHIMEDSLTKVNPAFNFNAFPTLSYILKHQVILWNCEICTTFRSIKLTYSLIKCMLTFVSMLPDHSCNIWFCTVDYKCMHTDSFTG